MINPIKVQFTIQIDNGRTNNPTFYLLADPTILGTQNHKFFYFNSIVGSSLVSTLFSFRGCIQSVAQTKSYQSYGNSQNEFVTNCGGLV